MFRRIVMNREGRLRIVWRILLFLVAGIGLTILLLSGFSLTGWVNPEWGQRLSLAFALFIAGGLLTRFVNRKPVTAIGLRPDRTGLRQLLLGLLLGLGMMGGILAAELALGSCSLEWRPLSTEGLILVLLDGVAVYFGAAISEELLFRGYPFQSMIQGIRFVPSMLILSILFAFAHIGNPNVTPLALLNIALAGVWLSYAYYRTRALWLPIGLHFSWNFAQTTLFGFPTSGIAAGEKSMISLTQSGPDLLTGGTFGPEGGLLATIALVLGTWHILAHRAYAKADGIVTLDSWEPPSAESIAKEGSA